MGVLFRITLVFLWLLLENVVVAQGIAIPKPKLTQEQWETASFKELFEESQYISSIDPQKAHRILDIIIKRGISEHNNKVIFIAYLRKGFVFENQLDFQNALTNYLRAEKTAENYDKKYFLDIKIEIAILYRKMYKYVEARKIYLYLIEEATKSHNNELLQNAYGGMGMLYSTTEDYENAIRYYEKAFYVAEESKNFVNACIYLDNMSEAYGFLKKYDKAFEYIDKALKIAENEFDTLSIIPLYERYGRLYADIGAFQKATESIDIGLNLCTKFEHLKDKNNLILAKAELYLKSRKLEWAEKTFLSVDENAININALTKVYYELGNIYETKKAWDLAETHFKKSRDLAEKNRFLRYDEWSNRALYRIYRAKSLSKEALFHLERADLLHDSLFNYEKSREVTELQFRYDLAQSEQKLKEEQLKTNRVQMIGGTVAALLLVLFLGYRIYLKGKTYDALQYKNQEIEAQKQQLEAYNLAILAKNQEIEAQKKQLEESNGMLKQFNYAVAHDLKEPLRNIGNFVSIIQRRYRSLLPEASTSYFEFVTTGVSRMGNMLEGLLKYSMLSTSQVTEIELLDVNELLNDVLQSLRLVIDEKQALVQYPSVMPSIMMNKIHLTQLFQNLLSNALKFVEKEPVIEIGFQEDKNNILFFIKDNGIGINEQSGKKLFNLFHRLHRDTQRFEGTGVGLALCKNIVEKYNGKIWFESVEGEGTTFYFQFLKK